jgi:transposase
MAVVIGVDPHKATHTAVAIDRDEAELGSARVRATRKQVPQLLHWAEPLGERTWAIESAGGLGYLLAQQLVAAGETVLDVPATLASRIRVLGTGRSDKNDPNDALSVAIAALRVPALCEVVAVDHAQVLRLLAKRNIDIGNHRTRVVCRLHNLVMELSPGGIAKELNASDAIALLERVVPGTPVETARHDLALELLADVQRLDEQLKESHRRIRTAIGASGTTLTELFCIGPIIACYLIGFTGDIGRFASRDHYAAYNGTAPVERSSGGRVVHRVSQRGNRRLNHALHLAAICQIRPAPLRGPRLRRPQTGRGQDQEGRDPLAQAPHQQRGLPPAPHRRRALEAIGRAREGTQERLCRPAWPAHILHTGSSDQATPGPDHQPYARRERAASTRPHHPRPGALTQRGFVGGEVGRASQKTALPGRR